MTRTSRATGNRHDPVSALLIAQRETRFSPATPDFPARPGITSKWYTDQTEAPLPFSIHRGLLPLGFNKRLAITVAAIVGVVLVCYGVYLYEQAEDLDRIAESGIRHKANVVGRETQSRRSRRGGFLSKRYYLLVDLHGTRNSRSQVYPSEYDRYQEASSTNPISTTIVIDSEDRYRVYTHDQLELERESKRGSAWFYGVLGTTGVAGVCGGLVWNARSKSRQKSSSRDRA